MSNSFNKLLIFAAGAAVGAVVTWKLMKDKYEGEYVELDSTDESEDEPEQQPEEEAKPHPSYVIETEEDEARKIIIEDGDTYRIVEEPDGVQYYELKPLPPEGYKKLVEDQGYKDYSTINKKEEKPVKAKRYNGPYIIEPDEFGECDNYETISLVYYADGVVEDELGDVMDEADVEEAVGADAFDHFGEYEADSVFIRNDEKRCDYEILRDTARWADISTTEND